jgi:hypothetical protein
MWETRLRRRTVLRGLWVSPVSVRRAKVRDFVHTHEYASGGLAFRKAVRVRTYDTEGKVPLAVLSVLDDPTQNVTQDVERVAAEVLLREYPEETVRAKRSKPWFLLVEHLPPGYDLSRPRESRREVFFYVEFDDYRVTVDWPLGLSWHVRSAQRALRENTRAELGVSRATLGYPSWVPTTKEEVEREAGTTLDDTLDAAPRGAPE